MDLRRNGDITSPRLTRPARLGIWLVAVALLILGAASQWPGQVDDAYITLAFARQLVESGRIAWSDGRVVEGYSSPLWLMVAALASLTKKDPSQLLQLASIAATAGCLWRLTPSSRLPFRSLPALVVLVVSLAESVDYWAANAMETMLFALLLAAGWGALAKGPRSPWGPLALSLAALTRPEGHIHLVLGLLVLLTLEWPTRRLWMRWWAAAGGMLALYHGLRVWYFGEVLPLPVMVKALDGHGFGTGLHQILVGDIGWLALVVAVNLATSRERRDRWLALAPLLVQVGVLTKAGDDWMGHSRLVMPGALASLAVLAQAETRPASRWRVVPVLLAAAIVIGVVSPTGAPLEARWRGLRPVVGALLAPRLDLDTTLKSDLQFTIPRIPTADFFYSSDVGMLGNVTGLGVRDLVGLTDRDIARSRAFNDDEALQRTLARLSGGATSALCIRMVNWGVEPTPSLPPSQAAAYPMTYRLRDPWSTITYHCRRTLEVDRDLAMQRWSALAERFPAHAWVGWNYAVSLAAVGRMEDARMTLAAVRAGAGNSAFGSAGDASLAFVESSGTLVMRGDSDFELAPGARLRSRPLPPSALMGATLRSKGERGWPTRLEVVAEQGACREDLGAIDGGDALEILLNQGGCASDAPLVSLFLTSVEVDVPASDSQSSWLQLSMSR